MFLTKSRTSDDIWLSRNTDPEIDDIENRKKKGLSDHIKKFVKNSKNMRAGRDVPIENSAAEYEQMQEEFKRQELGSGYDQKQHVPQQKMVHKRKQAEYNIENDKVRALCIAAFLRCLHAAIEYAPNDKLQAEAIRELRRDDNFFPIT